VIALAIVTLLLGYVLLYAGIKGGETAQRPWRGLNR
jgi:hypothetical protein